MPVRISVITAVRNRAGTIGEALSSVQSQTWPSVEHIVIDGASTDGTLDILKARRAQLSELVSEPDGGIYEALNKGIARATGDVLGFLHSDDCFAGTDTLACIAKLFEDPAVDAVYGDLEYVARQDSARVIRRWRAGKFSPRKLAHGWMPPHPTLYVRRRAYERWGVFDTSFRIAADYDLILRFLGQAELRTVYIPKVLVRMRVGGASNRTLMQMFRKSLEDYRVLRRNSIGGLWALAIKNLSKLGQFF